jgi:hypothetical protein
MISYIIKKAAEDFDLAEFSGVLDKAVGYGELKEQLRAERDADQGNS